MAGKKDVAGEVAKAAASAAAKGKNTVKKAAAGAGEVAAKGTKAAKGAVSAVAATATKGAKAAKGAATATAATAKATAATATATAAKGAKAVKDVAGGAAAAAKTTAAKGTKAVKDVAGGAAATAAKGKKAALGALGAVGGALGGIAAKAGDVAGDALDSAKGAAKSVVDKASDVAEGAIDKVQDLAGDAVDVAKDAAQNVVGAAGDAVEGAVDLAQDALGKVGSLGAGALGAGAAALGGAAALAGDGAEAAKDAVSNLVGDKKEGGVLLPLLLGLGIVALAWFGFNSLANKGANPATESAQSAAPAWLGAIGEKLKAQFAWLSLGHNGGAIVASGEAADKNAKDAALAAIAIEVEASEGKGASVIDNITVKGSTEAPVGAALAALGANPDVAACSKAFGDTMNGRTINFASGAATVSADSASLLNALTGIANACSAHKIEVAGHTDSTGDDAANLSLSQARADAVKAFWVSKGVKAEGLTAKGYGEAKPLEAGETEAAHAKNRRTEFMVSAAQ